MGWGCIADFLSVYSITPVERNISPMRTVGMPLYFETLLGTYHPGSYIVLQNGHHLNCASFLGTFLIMRFTLNDINIDTTAYIGLLFSWNIFCSFFKADSCLYIESRFALFTQPDNLQQMCLKPSHLMCLLICFNYSLLY